VVQVCEQNCSLQVSDSGIAIVSEGQRWQFGNDEIVGIRAEVVREPDLSGETQLIQSWKIHLRDEHGKDCWFELPESPPLGPREPLKQLQSRLMNGLADRAWQRLQAGDIVSGDGWSLSLMYFTETRTGTSCFVEQVDGTSWEGDELCVWHEDRPTVFARLPRNGENAELLETLIARLTGRPMPNRPTSPPTGLGPVLTRINTTHPDLISGRQLAIAAGLAIIALPLFLSLTTFGYCILLGSMGLLVGQPLLRGRTESLVCYQRGFLWTNQHDERLILSDRLRSVTEMRHGDDNSLAKQSTMDHLVLVGDRCADQNIVFPLELAATHRDSYVSLRNYAAGIIATRLEQQLSAEGSIHWTPVVTITRDGLRTETGSTITRTRFSWDQLVDWQLDDKALSLQFDGTEQPLMIRTSQPNFYAGLRLLQNLGHLRPAK
jgi:hypothetical protein